MGGINYKDVTLETEPIDYYLGRQHRVDLACGCALPTLSPEVIRSDSRVRCAYQTELLKLKGAISAGLTTGTEAEKQDNAWVILALLVGGVTATNFKVMD